MNTSSIRRSKHVIRKFSVFLGSNPTRKHICIFDDEDKCFADNGTIRILSSFEVRGRNVEM